MGCFVDRSMECFRPDWGAWTRKGSGEIMMLFVLFFWRVKMTD